MNLSAHGIRVGLPPAWEGRIYKRSDPAAQPVVHAANVALAPDDGDFATRTAELMPAAGVLVVMVEYEPALAATAQFAATGVPEIDPAAASPSHLLRRIPGQAGYQRFFNDSGRAFGLYVVIGAAARARSAMPKVDGVLATIEIDPLPAG
jgi:hypothetical protein